MKKISFSNAFLYKKKLSSVALKCELGVWDIDIGDDPRLPFTSEQPTKWRVVVQKVHFRWAFNLDYLFKVAMLRIPCYL